MKYTHLPFKYILLFVFVCFFTYFIGLVLLTALFCAVFIFALFSFRKNHSVDFTKNPAKNFLYAPISGKVTSIDEEDKFFKVTICPGIFDKFDIFIPQKSEVLSVKFAEFSGKKKLGVSFFGEKVKKYKLIFDKNIFGRWPSLLVLPGDLTKAKSLAGFFPFGGKVSVLIDKAECDIVVDQGIYVSAGESILAK